MIEVIAFDADDTLWYTESLYVMTQERFKEILLPYQLNGDVDDRLYKTEMRNLKTFGYGAKGFMLSMIETAIQLTEGEIQGHDIEKIINAVRDMMRTDIRLLEGVAQTIPQLAEERTLMIITKGDLLEQESKIARSGLADYFDMIEIVSSKNRSTYETLLSRNGIDLGKFLMVGNSMPSDILPILELGAPAVYIPHQHTWAHEQVDLEVEPKGLYRLDTVDQVLPLLYQLDAGS